MITNPHIGQPQSSLPQPVSAEGGQQVIARATPYADDSAVIAIGSSQLVNSGSGVHAGVRLSDDEPNPGAARNGNQTSSGRLPECDPLPDRRSGRPAPRLCQAGIWRGRV